MPRLSSERFIPGILLSLLMGVSLRAQEAPQKMTASDIKNIAGRIEQSCFKAETITAGILDSLTGPIAVVNTLQHRYLRSIRGCEIVKVNLAYWRQIAAKEKTIYVTADFWQFLRAQCQMVEVLSRQFPAVNSKRPDFARTLQASSNMIRGIKGFHQTLLQWSSWLTDAEGKVLESAARENHRAQLREDFDPPKKVEKRKPLYNEDDEGVSIAPRVGRYEEPSVSTDDQPSKPQPNIKVEPKEESIEEDHREDSSFDNDSEESFPDILGNDEEDGEFGDDL